MKVRTNRDHQNHSSEKTNPLLRAEMEFGVPAEIYRSDAKHRSSRSGAVAMRIIVALALAFVALLINYFICAQITFAGVVAAIIVFALGLSCVHVALAWERFVILRLGNYNRLGGPGLFFTIPVIEYCTMRIDQRTRITPFGAEETLAADMVPLQVDAVLTWVIWDPEKACTEVEDVCFAVSLAAQTALRDAVGRAAASEVVMRRNQLDQEIRNAIETTVNAWGVTVLGVKIRNLILPTALQESMSSAAQAERRRDARLVLMESETTIADLLSEAAAVYRKDPMALELRKMHLINEGMLDDEAAMVVPSAYTEGFADSPKAAQQS